MRPTTSAPTNIPVGAEVPTVVVCRGCCCGTEKKRPGIDHAARLQRLEELLNHTAHLKVTDCLGPCERSDIIVVVPSTHGRQQGARPIWLGQLNGRHEYTAVADWVKAGGPGLAALPESLRRGLFAGPRPPRSLAP